MRPLLRLRIPARTTQQDRLVENRSKRMLLSSRVCTLSLPDFFFFKFLLDVSCGREVVEKWFACPVYLSCSGSVSNKSSSLFPIVAIY